MSYGLKWCSAGTHDVFSSQPTTWGMGQAFESCCTLPTGTVAQLLQDRLIISGMWHPLCGLQRHTQCASFEGAPLRVDTLPAYVCMGVAVILASTGRRFAHNMAHAAVCSKSIHRRSFLRLVLTLVSRTTHWDEMAVHPTASVLCSHRHNVC